MESLRGRAVDNVMSELGEIMVYSQLQSAVGHQPRPIEGIYFDIYGRSGQILVGTSERVVRCRSARPRPEMDKWPAVEARAIRGTPWNPSGNMMEDDTAVIAQPDDPSRGQDQILESKQTSRRRFKISRWMLREFGWTSPCAGCESRRKRIGACLHSEACLERIEEELVKTQRGREIL